ncbi:MAG TPA: M1 family metallopeptidase [Oculatellaceae cyanobacterium]
MTSSPMQTSVAGISKRASGVVLALVFLSTYFLTAVNVPAFSESAANVGKTAKDAQTESAKYRLPDDSRPIDYEISLEPNMPKFSFTGSETIRLKVYKNTKQIVLNALDLQISDAKICQIPDVTTTEAKSGNVQPLTVKPDAAKEKVAFISTSVLNPGVYNLSCSFHGTLNTKLQGFYRASFEDSAHKKRWFAATQLEPTDARRVFPCYDEPACKATFQLSVKLDRNLTAISNTPIAHEEMSGSDKKTVRFEPTPKMSSYLVSLTCGDFKKSGTVTSCGIPISLWTIAGNEKLGGYALSQAPRILEYLTHYFGLPYLGKKLDLIALPEFGFGGMENVGAIVFPDSTLLIDDKTGSSFQRQSCFSVMAHEMAHQWFGDLVTMKWWDDLWLNESFATWMATKVEDALHPEWRPLTEALFTKQRAMYTDSLKTTRAIHAAVTNPSQAVEMIDVITYSKGASVLRMIESFISAPTFQRGVRRYLKDHQFSNASGEELWNALSAEASGVPVAAIARSFVMQAGYPQINATFSENGGSVHLSQYKQLQLGQDKKDSTLWVVPLCMRVVSAQSSTEGHKESINKLLSERENDIQLEPNKDPVYINSGGKGYYKTCYGHKHLLSLQQSFANLTADEKLVLLNDCSSLVLPGDINIEDDYDFIKKIPTEDDPMILSTLVSYLFGPDKYMTPDTVGSYQRLIRNYLKPLKSKLNGWNQKETDTQQTKELRCSVLGLLGTRGNDKETRDEAFANFQKYLKDHNSVNPDLVETMMEIVTFNGGVSEYEEFLKLWKNAKSPVDAEYAFYDLGGFHQPELAKRTLDLCMTNQVKGQWAVGLMCSLVFNKYTRDVAWAFLKQHWDEILKRFPVEPLRALASVGDAFHTAEKEKEVIAWYAKHPVPNGKAEVARTLESLHISVIYTQRYADRIRHWVKKEAG